MCVSNIEVVKLTSRTEVKTDGQWGTDRREKGNQALRLYHKTRWFWIVLVFVDLVSQACKTADSDDETLALLRESFNLVANGADTCQTTWNWHSLWHLTWRS